MGFYILKRILFFIPTLIIISLVAFMISINAPGDPVERMVSAAQSGGEISAESKNLSEQKKYWREKLGLDLPVFYLSISTLSQSDTLYKIYDKSEQIAMERLSHTHGQWKNVASYYSSLLQLETMTNNIRFNTLQDTIVNKNKFIDAYTSARFEIISLRSAYTDNIIQAKLKKLEFILFSDIHFKIIKPYFRNMVFLYEQMIKNNSSWRSYIPAIHFFPNNQYHRWIFGDGAALTGRGARYSKGIIRGDFGTSYLNKLPIREIIGYKIVWSLFFTLVSTLIAYLVSIPLGINSAVRRDTTFDRVTTVILFILYSLPGFWVATLLLMTFANPDTWLFFPASGIHPAIGYPPDSGWFDKTLITLPHLILPMLCYTYSSFAYLSRTMRVGLLEVLQQDYIRTARAKGLIEKTVINKHAVRNALFPIITVFANIFPMAIGGSVILESIFTLPGMGLEIFSSIQNQNYPMIVAVFTITGFLTLVGYLATDMLYAIVDPRISYSD